MPVTHDDMIDVAIQIIDERIDATAGDQAAHVLGQIASLAEATLQRAIVDSTARKNLRMIETLAVEMAYRLKTD